MLSISFQGWFQCRLATDPDPCDEPRGISGWTFALPGEPELDRIIRTRPAHTVRRTPGPQPGVAVREVTLDGRPLHVPLFLGAPFELLEDPVFDGRNGLQAEDGFEPIFRFHLRLQQNGVLLRREHREPATGDWVVQESMGGVPWPSDAGAVLELLSLAPYLEGCRQLLSEAKRAALKDARRRAIQNRLDVLLADPLKLSLAEAFRTRRWLQLRRALENEKDAVARLALQKRLGDMLDGVLSQAERVLLGAVRYRYELSGPHEFRDSHNLLGGRVEEGPWVADFLMGLWDADALAGYMRGTLQVPFTHTRGG